MQPLLDAPPPVHPYEPGSWGPEAADELVAGHGRWHGPWIDVMSAVEPQTEPAPQSAAAPSPFPPIADYAFLSNCHTGALVAPDGAIDWLCVPRFDSPSVFGSLLDRAGRVLPVRPVRHQPSDRASLRAGDERARDDLEDADGWIVVRDALTMGPRDHEDTITPHTRPPADDDADHMLVRTVECLEGRGRGRARLRARLRLRP